MRIWIWKLLFAAGVCLCALAVQGQSLGVRAAGSYLGVGMTDVAPERAKALRLDSERGVEVTKVQPGGPIDKAGIRPGDVLLTYNGETILGGQQLVRLVGETPQGRHVKIQYWRDGKLETAMVLTSAPPVRTFDMPPGFPNFDIPSFRGFSMPTDVPTPMLLWRNSLLGIECEAVDAQLAEYFGVEHGLLVRATEKGLAADKAGVKVGDVLLSADGRELESSRDLTFSMRSESRQSKPIQVALMRNHKRMAVAIPRPGGPE
jgi:serine protease Do